MKRFNYWVLGVITAIGITAWAAPETFRNDALQFGRPASVADKDLIFDTGDGATNTKITVDDATKTLATNSNNVQLGDGVTSDKTITANIGGLNPFLRWDDSAGTWVVSNDGVVTNPIGGVSGGNFDLTVCVSGCDHATLTLAVGAAVAGDSIILLSNITDSPTITKELFISGIGRGNTLTGTITFDGSSDFSRFTNIRVTGLITLQSGADGVIVDNIWTSQSTIEGAILVDDAVTGEFIGPIILE